MSNRTDPRMMWIFMHELGVQCRFALLAVQGLRQGQELVPAFYAESEAMPSWQLYLLETNELRFYFAHSFFSHMASISKILWPPRPRDGHPFSQEERLSRAQELKGELGITDSSVLRRRIFRDHLEHFDERLEMWSLTEAGQTLNLVDLNHSPFGTTGPGVQVPDQDTLRLADSLAFRFRGDSADIETIADELRHLSGAVRKWQARESRKRVPIPGPGPGEQMAPRVITSNLETSDVAAQEYLRRRGVILSRAGISSSPEGYSQKVLSEAIESRGWSLATSHDGDVRIACASMPEDTVRRRGTVTAIARAWAPEVALVLALATLLEEEENERDAPPWR